jgi:hypothetical protein
VSVGAEGNEPAFDRGSFPWSAFSTLFLATTAVLALLASAATILADPFWIFRREPPWLAATGGLNRALDVEMRRAKPLQFLAREGLQSVLVGSSTVYRGLRPADMPCAADRPVYNLGLSSLMAAELPTIAGLISLRRIPKVVVGLDYFMFTAFPGPPPLDPALLSTTGRTGAWARTVFSWRALTNSLPFMIGRTYEPGQWQFDGFKITPAYPAEVTRRIASEQDFAVQAYRPETLRYLGEALASLDGAEVSLYLSPMSGAQRALAESAGRWREILQWRSDIAALAARTKTRFADLTDSHGSDDFEPSQGSSRFWLDNVHFTPEVGRWTLEQVAGEPCGIARTAP